MGIFKAYDIRGTVPDELDAPKAHAIGRAFGVFLRAEQGRTGTVAVGHDMRVSSPKLAAAITHGLNEAGFDVVHIGRASTPMLNFAVAHLNLAGGVAVTASHNPARYNGFKLCRREGAPLSGTSGLGELERWVDHENRRFKPARRKGQRVRRSIFGAYKRYLLSHVTKGRRAVRVVVDCGNGMTGPYEFKVLQAAFPGTRGQCLEPDGRFPNHEANPIVEGNIKDLEKAVVQRRADCGIAFDGDGDRVVLVDERGQMVSGDGILGLLATRMLECEPGSVVLYDLRSSWGVKEAVERSGGRAVKSRVGHAFIKALLREHKGLLAGELSGHYYFRDFFYLDCGGFAALKVLEALSTTKVPLSELIAPFLSYPKTPEINFRVHDAAAVLRRLEESYRGRGTIEHIDGLSVETADWWFNVRMSNTEPLVRLNMEARRKETLERELPAVIDLIGGERV